MNKKGQIIIMVFLVFVFNHFISGQENYLEPHKGGEFIALRADYPCLDKQQRNAIIQKCRETIKNLKAEGIITSKIEKNNAGFFLWPVRAASNLNDFSFYGITGFVDHNSAFPDQLLDFNGGQRTYDTEAGYNHQGVDIVSWPFFWYKMDHSQVEVVSAADGVIIEKIDGNFDRKCSWDPTEWNAVYVRHANDVVTLYGHMKKNTTTSKIIGDSVFAGEYLGVVGSSGISNLPHLHFEVLDATGKVIDPWVGPSNPTVSESRWVEQKPYYDSKINAVSTHSDWPVFPDCPEQETPNFKNEFLPGDEILFITYYQDQMANQNSSFSVKTPENISWQNWDHSMSASHYWASWWGWTFSLPSNASLGTWTFSVTYEGNQYNHEFRVTNNPTKVSGETAKINEFTLSNIYPNPFNPSTTIDYIIAERSLVTLKIYDLLGREISDLVNDIKNPGSYSINFSGSELSSGTYIVRLNAENYTAHRKIVLLK